MQAHFDSFMRNSLLTELSDQLGGNNQQTTPNGGFPPIYLCEKEKPLEKKQEYETELRAVVSIKDIIQKKKTEPFIVLTE